MKKFSCNTWIPCKDLFFAGVGRRWLAYMCCTSPILDVWEMNTVVSAKFCGLGFPTCCTIPCVLYMYRTCADSWNLLC